ncbi:molybdopterin-dependent oxidoreductase [Sphingomonas sp. ID1715]|uniref:molybdopterin-dependent oxidoreductase n=1 Tax=Sphingomonas sp. ID1715 TaxID=1656898 RepID=UPI001489BAD1|nr:molybdopterin-dependent oxidoreductase [Sphingomonas sp. ID1715]NNM75877.1 molybdopterin-dependent oxidoreductase [Sphingomonas sp. ID1715]
MHGFARRELILGAAALAGTARAQRMVDLALPGGPSQRPTSSAFPHKGEMIVQRVRPPLLETPFEVFDQGVFTPNDRFFVRWHLADIPTSIDPASFRLAVRGAVAKPLSLSLDALMKLPRIEYAAVNQCSGNSRGLFEPRIAGAQWRHGAMGNARWTGVKLKDVLDLAGVQSGAVAVRFGGLDGPLVSDSPDYLKSLAVDHARDGEVMIAWAQNGEPLPWLNGYPLRLIVPGWFSTYWVKMLSDIEVLDKTDDNYWMAKAYRVPDTPYGNVAPGAQGFATKPISAMPPRSWITSHADGTKVAAGRPLDLRGIALGGDQGVAKVEVSTDAGASWRDARLGADEGRYSFRRFDLQLPSPAAGPITILTRCTNSAGVAQPMTPNWNHSGYLRNVVEATQLVAA